MRRVENSAKAGCRARLREVWGLGGLCAHLSIAPRNWARATKAEIWRTSLRARRAVSIAPRSKLGPSGRSRAPSRRGGAVPPVVFARRASARKGRGEAYTVFARRSRNPASETSRRLRGYYEKSRLAPLRRHRGARRRRLDRLAGVRSTESGPRLLRARSISSSLQRWWSAYMSPRANRLIRSQSDSIAPLRG